ncbi:DUF3349 domain-containing protein [Mycobacterium sp. 050134]|uniref:DUF3349 domain-containing protein n=1 Tax=Mycobacterium sp. 050134 TaxID=3096111 RepID=UPI002ED9CB6A
MSFGTCVTAAVAFLRVGYPNGAPAMGYAPLLALLPRRVSEEEISAIAKKLLARTRRPADRADVGVEIIRVTDEMPSQDDIRRVQSRLAADPASGV